MGVPTIWAQNMKDITLFQVGGSYSAIIDIARQATKDLGFKIEMQNAASDAVVNRVATQPQSLDIADIEYWILVKLIPRGALQAVDLQRFKCWDKVVPIFTKGEYPDGRLCLGKGLLPYEVQYLEQPEGKGFAKGPTRWATAIPTVYNADTLGCAPIWSSGRSSTGTSCSIPSSRAGRRCSMCPRSASWTPPWRSSRAATSNMATRAI